MVSIVSPARAQWFVYRYLLFKPDREELGRTVEDIKRKIVE